MRSNRVLLIDTDAAARESAAARLREAGYEVLPAWTFQQFHEALAEWEPGAVVIEPVLDGIDGFELSRAIRTSYPSARPEIIIASSKLSGSVPHSKARQVGARRFVEAPTDDPRLVDAIEEVLAAAGPPPLDSPTLREVAALAGTPDRTERRRASRRRIAMVLGALAGTVALLAVGLWGRGSPTGDRAATETAAGFELPGDAFGPVPGIGAFPAMDIGIAIDASPPAAPEPSVPRRPAPVPERTTAAVERPGPARSAATPPPAAAPEPASAAAEPLAQPAPPDPVIETAPPVEPRPVPPALEPIVETVPDESPTDTPAGGSAARPVAEPTVPDRPPVYEQPVVEAVTITEPVAISRVEPSYPPIAHRHGIKGKVVVRAVVRADGTVGAIEVIEESAPRWRFGQAAREAIRGWRYEPARRNGEPIESSVVIQLVFDSP